MNLQNRSLVMVTLLTLGLYFSGFFVFLTPLPVIYHLLRFRKEHVYQAVWPSILIVATVYLYGVDFILELYQKHPSLVWILPVPVIDLVHHFTQSVVSVAGIGYFSLYLAMAWLIAKVFTYSQNKAFTMLCVFVVGLFVTSGVAALIMVYPQSGSLLAAYRGYVQQGVEGFILAQEKAGVALQQLVALKSAVPALVDYSFHLLPFILLLIITVLFVMNLVIAKRFFAFSIKGLAAIRLSEFRVPFFVVWMAVLFTAVLIVNELTTRSHGVYFALLNVLLSLGIVYFFQGLAVLIHFLDEKKVVGIFRFLSFLLLVFFHQAGIVLLTVAGFADNWLDLRKLEKKKA